MMQLTQNQAIDRLSLGASAQLDTTLQHHDVSDWITRQLAPGNEPTVLQAKLSSLEVIRLDPVQLFERYWIPFKQRKDPQQKQRYREQARELYMQTANARLWRAYESPWQLRELLVDFWFNHFNVFARKGPCILWTGSFEEQAIRPHVLGRFSDLLLATAKHPAMLFYLDNWMNTTPDSPRARGAMKGLNENYAREVMELHTIGLHYTQADVAGATRLLTGWGLRRSVGFRFDPVRHDFSEQTILGRRFAGGEEAVTEFFEFLATHPQTAHHITNQLAQYFVADKPPTQLLTHMRQRYQETQGDLRAVTQAMIEHPAFAEAAVRRDKYRTPYRYVMAVMRASGRSVQNNRPIIGTLHQLGQPLYGCVTPNGWANTQDEWLSPDALTARLNFAVALGGGWLPITTSSDENMMSMATPQRAVSTKRKPHHPIDPETVLATLGSRISPKTIAVARQALPRLRASVLLGSPQMQYC